MVPKRLWGGALLGIFGDAATHKSGDKGTNCFIVLVRLFLPPCEGQVDTEKFVIRVPEWVC